MNKRIKVNSMTYWSFNSYSEALSDYFQRHKNRSHTQIIIDFWDDGKKLHITDHYEEPKKTFEQCCFEFHKKRKTDYCYGGSHYFTDGDYTICVLPKGTCDTKQTCGVAKRYYKDTPDPIIGRVAAFARATKQNLDEMIGYEP